MAKKEIGIRNQEKKSEKSKKKQRNGIIKNKVKSRIPALLLALVMALGAAGCAGSPDSADGTADGAAEGSAGNSTDAAGSDGGQTAMGRYVEEEIELPAELWRPLFAGMMDDGSIVIVDNGAGFLVSEDKGSTWSEQTPEWFKSLDGSGDAYITSLAMGPDKTMAVVYYAETDSQNAGADDYYTSLKFITPDGVETPVDIALPEEDKYIYQVVSSGDGRFFARTAAGIYQIFQDGTSEKLVAPEYSSYIWVKDDLLYIDSDWEDVRTPMIYDLDKGDYVEDEVLQDFVAENYSGHHYNGTDYGDMMLMPAADGTVYVIGQKGIHRHVVGGNMVEQVVDGKLSLLGNPRYAATVSVLQPEENVFLALCANSKLVRFTYDPNVPSVPENMLTVYSLKENDNIRQAISYYQSRHADTFVSYETAMGSGSAVTRDDALKKLNTEIMAGKGPDLIILDDMPIDSYVEKGLLLDLTDYLKQYSAAEPLFDNMTEAMMIDGRAYMAPATVSVPVLAAGSGYTADMTDMSGVADAIEKMRGAYPDDLILHLCGEKHILQWFAATSAPEWIKEDGSMDMDAIGAYLEQCRRIYEAQREGLDADVVQQSVERYNRIMESYEDEGSMYALGAYMDIMDYITGGIHMLAGWISSTYEYEQIISVDKTEGYEDTAAVPMQGQCSGIFMPHTLLGINAMSGQTEKALEFMDVFLSAEAQGNYDGIPFNQKAFDIQFTPKEDVLGENNEYGGWATTDKEGNMVEFDVYFPTAEQLAAFKGQLASVDTAYIRDSVMEDAVFTLGGEYIQGNRSLENTLGDIEKRLAIYMAE